MFDRLKCKIGIHAWGPWQYSAADSCAQTRVCQRCQTTGNQTEHVWGRLAIPGARFLRADASVPALPGDRTASSRAPVGRMGLRGPGDSCEQVRRCQRCRRPGNAGVATQVLERLKAR